MAKVKSISTSRKGAQAAMRIELDRRLTRDLKIGDSVCINGACLTVTRLSSSKGEAEFEMVAETMRRTNLGSLRAGDMVNIERPLRAGDRLDGHFVLGHVDGTGTIDEVIRLPSETKIWIKLDDDDNNNDDNNNYYKKDELLKALVPKGSIAVDGVSLTIVDVEADRFSISLIPHTLGVTTLGLRSKGDRVNIEADILGKYVAKNFANASHVKDNSGDSSSSSRKRRKTIMRRQNSKRRQQR